MPSDYIVLATHLLRENNKIRREVQGSIQRNACQMFSYEMAYVRRVVFNLAVRAICVPGYSRANTVVKVEP